MNTAYALLLGLVVFLILFIYFVFFSVSVRLEKNENEAEIAVKRKSVPFKWKDLVDSKNKKLGFIVNYDLLPKSYYFQKLSNEKKISPKHHLFNGDDYQILFSAKKKYRKIIHKYSIKWNQKVTRIGSITNSVNNYMIFNDKLIKIKDYRGYTHNFR